MRAQIATILWAQIRMMRNHLPLIGFGSLVGNALTALWYALVLTAGVGLAVGLPYLPGDRLVEYLGPALLGVCLVWQFVPLFTLSTGWSLQLNKLQVYPVPTRALFGIEVLLRVTATPELLILLLGATMGLLRHRALPPVAPASILLLVPINLLLSLSIRELLLHSFKRNRFREIFSVLVISLALAPQILLRTTARDVSSRYILTAGNVALTPWKATAHLASGQGRLPDFIAVAVWLGLTYLLARWFFARSLRVEDGPQSAASAGDQSEARTSRASRFWERLFGDPTAAMVQKEMQSLLRMPRFRVAFGMACVFSVVILLPMANNASRAGVHFLSHNFLPFVAVYGLLILSDSLILNVFGTDRSAVALYFIAPVSMKTVIRAKNITAVLFIAVQSVVATLAAGLFSRNSGVLEMLTALGAVVVVGLFFLCVGNMTSVLLARPTDPRQTMRKAAGGKMQLWLLLCMAGMVLLLGAGYLAQWALGAVWAFFVVLAIELGLGLVFYFVALDSAIEHADRDREKLIDALSRGPAMIGSGD